MTTHWMDGDFFRQGAFRQLYALVRRGHGEACRGQAGPIAALTHAAIDAVNNKIYVIGGRLGSAFIFTASNTNVVEEYDRATNG